MNKIKIVTDSSANLHSEILENLSIGVVPVKVRFGEEEFTDGMGETAEQFYNKMRRTNDFPSAIVPSVENFLEIYREMAEETEQVISLHTSSKLSNAIVNAKEARLIHGPDLPPDIEVLDSHTTSLGLGLMVMEAARLAKEGATKQEIVKHINSLKPKMRILIAVHTLAFFQLAGWIERKVSLALGSLIHRKALLWFKDGEFVPETKIEKKLGEELLFQRMTEIIASDIDSSKKLNIGIQNAGVPQLGEKLSNFVKKNLPCNNIISAPYVPSFGFSSGPGAIGIAYYTV